MHASSLRTLFSALLLCSASLLQAEAKPRAYYELIILREPFGAMAAETAAGPEGEASVQDPEKVREESNKIQLCAMTDTPDGRTAVGIIDNGVQPPAYLTLFTGETASGLELILSDLDREVATFRREGVTFTLKLGLGLVETVTPDLLEQRKLEAKQAEAEAKEKERKRPNSLAEQLIAMQMSLPPDVEAPPLPIPPTGDAAEFTKAFNPDKLEGEPQSEKEALIKAGVAQMKEAAAEGESPQDYLRRLVEHRSKEVKRQQEEKKKAQQALDEMLSSGQYSEADADYLRRRTNIDLMKKGVVPLSPVQDISKEEQAEIDAALRQQQ